MPAAGAAPAPNSTLRLIVRPLTADDDGALLRFRGNLDAVRFLSHAALSHRGPGLRGKKRPAWRYRLDRPG